MAPSERVMDREVVKSFDEGRTTAPRRKSADTRVAVVGAGPAGLTAAYELASQGLAPAVFEATEQVGGIARTEQHDGFRFDIGGHRFFTKVTEVEELWHRVMGADFIRVRRLSRIFYRGKYFAYPLQLLNTLGNIGIYESIRIVLSYLKWNVFPIRDEENFEQWVINRFGKRLYLHFFKTYTEKVWGIPCDRIRADWAAQRIRNLSLVRAVLHSITGQHNTATLIDEFYYPRLGPGMMWQRFRELVEADGGQVHLRSRVQEIRHDEGLVSSVMVKSPTGQQHVEVDHLINSMPISTLILSMKPEPPPAVVKAARELRYRDFLIVTLVLDQEDPFPDNWLYIHSPDVRVGRIQNFRAWSEELVPAPGKASIGMEYFCNVDDELWLTPDDQLIEFATRELGQLGLADDIRAIDGYVIRQEKAYPVYDEHYSEHLETIRRYLGSFRNLQTIGRNGMHRYNNQDHSMLTGMLAARNVLGQMHDLWDINVERSYHEEFETKSAA